MVAQSTGQNATGNSVGFGGDGFKLGGGRCFASGVCDVSPLGGIQGGRGSLFGFPYESGSFADHFVEAYAGPHDFLNSGYWYDGAGNAINHPGLANGFGEALNGLNVVIATPFVGASVLPSSAYYGLLK